MADDTDRIVEVPASQLSPETLRALVEEFVTRDGTDYGRSEKSIEQKVADVMRQLARGDVKIVFDQDTQTANIVVRRQGIPGTGTKI